MCIRKACKVECSSFCTIVDFCEGLFTTSPSFPNLELLGVLLFPFMKSRLYVSVSVSCNPLAICINVDFRVYVSFNVYAQVASRY